MSKLQEFISQVKNHGLMRTARYTVIIPDSNNGSLLGMYCDQVQLPGLNYNTVANNTYGESREIPYGRLFENMTLSFYVDNDMKVKKFFDTWLYSIQNPVDRTFNYYTNYIQSVQIDVEDLESMTKYSVMLRECYPKTVGSIQLDYASKDIMKLSVTMAYKYWEPIQLYNENELDYINKSIGGVYPEAQGIFNGITSSPAFGILENYGVTALQNKLIGMTF